jgi:hypothetical protein
MVVNGKNTLIDESGTIAPVLHQGQTFLPIASVIKEFGGTVEWFEAERKVLIQLGANRVELWMDSNKAVVNNDNITLDVAPTIINGKAMVPLRFVGDHVGLQLRWHGNSQVISLVYQEGGQPSFWFAKDYVKAISNEQGQYEDGAASYVTTYPLAWGDPYVINQAFSQGKAYNGSTYELETVFLNVDRTTVVGTTHALNVTSPGVFESPSNFMKRTGRVPVEEVVNGEYRKRTVDQYQLKNADVTYSVVNFETELTTQKEYRVENEFLFFKGAYVVSLKFSGYVDSETFNQGGAAATPHFQEFLETVIDSFSFTGGAGAAG